MRQEAEKILVTGGAGFLGSYVCERLLQEGKHVICLDNLYTGNAANIAHLISNERFQFLNHDITQPIDAEVEGIFHLACPASPPHYQRDPIYTLQTSIQGTLHMLELARRYHAKILFSSTSEVYGDPLIHPQREDYFGNVNTIGPRACYDEGKRCSETLFMEYCRQYGVNIRIVRIFNTYGPRMNIHDGRVVSNFIYQALSNKQITIFGDGTQTRSFCYVDDLIDGMIRMYNGPDDFTGPVNLGNPDEFQIQELAAIVLQLTGAHSEIVYYKLPKDDPVRRKPDIQLAVRMLQWRPRIPLEEGLRRTIDGFKRKMAVMSNE